MTRDKQLKSLLKGCTKDSIIEYLAERLFLDSPESIALAVKRRQFEKETEKLEEMMSENSREGNKLMEKLHAAKSANEIMRLKIKIIKNNEEYLTLCGRWDKVYNAWKNLDSKRINKSGQKKEQEA